MFARLLIRMLDRQRTRRRQIDYGWVDVLLEIHPFQDGNGRLSRILTILLLLRAGYSYVPHTSLESVIEQSKEGLLSRPSPDPGDGEDRCAKLAAMGDVFPSRIATTNEAPGQKNRTGEDRPRGVARTVNAHHRAHARTRKSHHQRHRTTNGYEQKHIEATLPPVGRRRPSFAPRPRTWRVVRIALRKGVLFIARGMTERADPWIPPLSIDQTGQYLGRPDDALGVSNRRPAAR